MVAKVSDKKITVVELVSQADCELSSFDLWWREYRPSSQVVWSTLVYSESVILAVRLYNTPNWEREAIS